jgi:hypothetical protein
MSTKPDIKKPLEAIVGHKLNTEALQFINLIESVASSNITLDGSITKRNLLLVSPNECSPSRLLDVSGHATSGSDGKSLFRLNSFLCPFGGVGPIDTSDGTVPLPPPLPPPKFSQPINVVASPLSSTPCFLTLVHSLVDNGADVEIKVSTWDANGVAAPHVSFDWRCRVPLLSDPILRSAVY